MITGTGGSGEQPIFGKLASNSFVHLKDHSSMQNVLGVEPLQTISEEIIVPPATIKAPSEELSLATQQAKEPAATSSTSAAASASVAGGAESTS